jgi:hypothetical protein
MEQPGPLHPTHDNAYSWQNYLESIQVNLSVYRLTGFEKLQYWTGPYASNT